jgi:hypothetical protein
VLNSPDCATIRDHAFLPSIPTLMFSSTRNQRRNCGPIFVIMRLYRMLHLVVFTYCPITLASTRWDPRHRAICSYTEFSFDPEPARQWRSNPCHLAFAPHPSACCLRLRSIYPCVHSPGRCWDPRHHVICASTDFSFDLEPARRLHPNPCRHEFVLYPSACCLRLLTIYPCVQEAFGQWWDPRHHAI